MNSCSLCGRSSDKCSVNNIHIKVDEDTEYDAMLCDRCWDIIGQIADNVVKAAFKRWTEGFLKTWYEGMGGMK